MSSTDLAVQLQRLWDGLNAPRRERCSVPISCLKSSLKDVEVRVARLRQFAAALDALGLPTTPTLIMAARLEEELKQREGGREN